MVSISRHHVVSRDLILCDVQFSTELSGAMGVLVLMCRVGVRIGVTESAKARMGWESPQSSDGLGYEVIESTLTVGQRGQRRQQRFR
jgi:hypothetical protein